MLENKIPQISECYLQQLETKLTLVVDKQLSNEALLSLHTLFGPVLKKALDLLERYPKLSLYHTNGQCRALIEVQDTNNKYYRLFLRTNYCQCSTFKSNVVERHTAVTCEHVLAARIAMILGKLNHSFVTKEQYLVLLRTVFDVEETDSISAFFCPMTDGIKFTVEEDKCFQASVYIPVDNFTEYSIKKDIVFKISLAVLTECLSICSTSDETSIKMYYKMDGSPLILVLQSQADDIVVTTNCEIYTQLTRTALDFDDDSTEVARIILKAKCYSELLAEVRKSSDVIELHFAPTHPNFRIVTYIGQDESCIVLPKCSDMVLSFCCETSVSFKYQFPRVRNIVKALAISDKMILLCKSTGLLILQMKLEKEDVGQMFSEFFILPIRDL